MLGHDGACARRIGFSHLLIGWFFCMLTTLIEKLGNECSMKFWEEKMIRCDCALYSYLKPGILFSLCLFAISIIAQLYYCSLGVSSIMPVILVMSPISISCTSLTLQT